MTTKTDITLAPACVAAEEYTRRNPNYEKTDTELYNAFMAGVAWQARAAVEADRRERNESLTPIYDAFGIGELARTPGILMTNLGNVIRRSRCLSAIERVLTVETPPDPDEGDNEPGEECLLRWGAGPDGYAEHFKAALAEWQRRGEHATQAYNMQPTSRTVPSDEVSDE
jgi:hypothetical protein